MLLCQFLVLAITTGKKSPSRLSGWLCCCVSFWFWREIGSYFVVVEKFYYNRKKKSSSRLSGGLCCCVSFWFWREIGSFFVVAGKFYYNRKKEVLVVCLAGCAVVSVFGSGDYDRKKKL